MDPSIKLIACGDNNMDWNRTVLRLVGSRIDFLAIHHYYGSREMRGDPLNLIARPLHYESFYLSVQALIRELVPDRPMKLAVNEWGLAMPIEREHGIEAALYAARVVDVLAAGDLVEMTCVSDLINGWPGGIIQASRHGVFVTPTYLVSSSTANTSGKTGSPSRFDSPTFDSSREGRHVPYLDAVASRSADRKHIFLKAVNTDQRRSQEATISFKDARLGSRATLSTLESSAPGRLQ